MVKTKQILRYMPPEYCDHSLLNLKKRQMIVIHKKTNPDSSKEIWLVNVTTKKKENQEPRENLRRSFFKRSEAALIPIKPQHPFDCPCFAKLNCHYSIEHFDHIDRLIWYNGESVSDSVIDDIKNNKLFNCDKKTHFTEEQIRAVNDLRS